jgi:hypothetical protein
VFLAENSRGVKPALALLALALSAALWAGGCGGESSDPLVEPPRETVGTLSEESAREAIVQDVNAIREAMESGRADEATLAIYELLNRAGEVDVAEGGRMIRRELPRLVETFVASHPAVRGRVEELALRTEGGEAVRELALELLDEDLRLFRSFRDDVAESELTWGAAVRFGEENNALVQRSSERIDEILAGMPEDDRAALEQAVREVFG